MFQAVMADTSQLKDITDELETDRELYTDSQREEIKDGHEWRPDFLNQTAEGEPIDNGWSHYVNEQYNPAQNKKGKEYSQLTESARLTTYTGERSAKFDFLLNASSFKVNSYYHKGQTAGANQGERAAKNTNPQSLKFWLGDAYPDSFTRDIDKLWTTWASANPQFLNKDEAYGFIMQLSEKF